MKGSERNFIFINGCSVFSRIGVDGDTVGVVVVVSGVDIDGIVVVVGI